MLDYHLHLWPHHERDRPVTLEELRRYCEQAAGRGVSEIALTEHLFRFAQADDLLRGWWEDEADDRLRRSMADYWAHHATADLDTYVETVLEAQRSGLPVLLGLEVDFYRGRMDEVARLLSAYPFDVLLGSVHWIGTWRFDDVDDELSVAHWDTRGVDEAWGRYTEAVEELAASGVCDVLAHPDLAKVTGRRPAAPEECWDRLVEALRASGMAAEVSSAGWRKPVAEPYPAPGLLERLVAAGVPLTTASDAHDVATVGDRVLDLRALLEAAGVRELQAFRTRKGRPVALVP